jgi:hypothetical protein
MATHIRRREFVAALGGAALPAAWPRAAGAQQPKRMRRIGAAARRCRWPPTRRQARLDLGSGMVRCGEAWSAAVRPGEASLTKGSARAEPFSICPARCGRCRSPGRRTTIRRASLARARLSGHGPRAPRAEHAAAVSRRRARAAPRAPERSRACSASSLPSVPCLQPWRPSMDDVEPWRQRGAQPHQRVPTARKRRGAKRIQRPLGSVERALGLIIKF